MRAVIGVDLGATWTRVALFHKYKLINKVKFPTPSQENKVSEAVISAAKKLAYTHGAKISAFGIATFGPIDFESGTVVNPPNHPARRIELRSQIERILNVPVILVNDAVAGAVSEYFLGSRGLYRDLVYVAIGTGIGIGVIMNGEPLLGWRGDSHEAGHIVLDYKSPVTCGCGGRGHWESLYSGSALKRGVAVQDPHPVVAAGIATLVACYDPQLVSLGGGLVEAGKISVERLRRMVGNYSFQNRVPPIREHPLGGDANLYGSYLAAVKPGKELLRLNGW